MTSLKKSKKALRKRHVSLNPKTDNLDSLLKKASMAHREGGLAQAERFYLEVLKQRPKWGPVLNALGTVFMDQARPDQAQMTFEKATHLKPPYAPAFYNLGSLKQVDNDHQGAVNDYNALLEIQPDFGPAWNNLGTAYRETGHSEQALSCFRKATEFAPDMPEAWNNLGVAQDETELVQDAVSSFSKAIEIRSDYASAHFNLGVSLQKLGLFKQAEDHYREVLETRPDDKPARFMLQSLGVLKDPGAAPVDYVRKVFDGCAGSFEEILIDKLKYRTPELLFDLVRPYLIEDMRILDLGCGTGLGSEFYRPFAKRMVGVDASVKMLEKAEEKRTYDQIEAFDILQDWQLHDKFDLIYSSDVFVYVGNLDFVIRPVSSHLVPNGIIAFSVENLSENGAAYKLFPSGRYAHSLEYIREVLSRHKFQVLSETTAVIRKQGGNDVQGMLVVAKKKNVHL